MSDHALPEKKKRIWEIDALRGILILLVLCNHLQSTVEDFMIHGIYKNFDILRWIEITDPLNVWFQLGSDGIAIAAPWIDKVRSALTRPIVDLFFVVSGLSCVFSRNNLKSGLRILAGAGFISIFTWILTIITEDRYQFIRFGVLHCYALCHLIYYFMLEKASNKVMLIVVATSLIVGYTLRYLNLYSHYALLVPFGIREYGAVHRDYWPVFPMLGWFLIGVILGKRFYSKKETLLPSQSDRQWHRPLCFLGRYSGLFYCGHMVVYTVMFCGIGYIFDLY